jgi:hypothetical protein
MAAQRLDHLRNNVTKFCKESTTEKTESSCRAFNSQLTADNPLTIIIISSSQACDCDSEGDDFARHGAERGMQATTTYEHAISTRITRSNVHEAHKDEWNWTRSLLFLPPWRVARALADASSAQQALQLEYSASSKAAEQYTADHLTSLRFDFTCFAVTCMPLFRPTPLLFSALALLIVKLKDRTATATIEGYWRWILPVLGASRPCGTTMPSLLEHLLKAYFSSNMEPTLILP